MSQVQQVSKEGGRRNHARGWARIAGAAWGAWVLFALSETYDIYGEWTTDALLYFGLFSGLVPIGAVWWIWRGFRPAPRLEP